MASFSIPLSGLNASSQELSIIANNLANINTPGYKSSSAEFSSLFYQNLGTSGNGDPMQVGTGANLGSVTMDMTDGAPSATGVNSNAAIQGEGMFVLDNNGQQMFTRAGNFTVSNAGFLTAPDGSLVQGYPAVNGVVNTNAPLSGLQVGSGVTTPATATANVQIGLNLDSQSAVGTSYSDPVQVYDSLGGTHTVTATFTKTASDTWNYSVTLPGADTGGTSPTTLGTGTLNFDTSGNVTAPPSTVTLTSGALANGAAALNFTWHLFNSNGTSLVTQTASASAPLSSQQDGGANGNLLNFNIQPDGTVEGSFSNGQTKSLGQIVMANFANPQGLQGLGNNEFQATVGSGAANIGVPGTGGLGQLTGGSIEQSNVDIAAQFSTLIQAQNSYTASAKAVTAFNQVTQTALNMSTGL
jgi:flagellar hook protein FlgE